MLLVSHRQAARRTGHEYASRAHAGNRLAALLGYAYAGDYREGEGAAGHTYFLPDDTLIAGDAEGLGIRCEDDLFGGVAPYSFVAGKAITHGLVSAEARAPFGWSPALAPLLAGVVLQGYTAFARADARSAARRLLRRGDVRLKRVAGLGGAGQAVATDLEEFEGALAAVTDEELAAQGVVIEQNLEEAVTYSVGQLHVGGRRISYYGLQRTVRNHHDHLVYGGSDLVVARGGVAALERLDLPATAREALIKARHYDAMVAREFPGFFASRRNYDVLCGRDADGAPRVGVLEQSWRFGGASAAEIAALHAFERDPGLAVVRASTHEVYADIDPPAEAVVSFRGVDPQVGPLTKYCTVEAHGHPA